MNNEFRWRGVFALLALLFGASSALAQDKPNIVVIWGDDIGWYNISAYNLGVMGYETPNIDRIAKEGALCPPTGTGSRAVPPGARRSLRVSRRYAPAC